LSLPGGRGEADLGTVATWTQHDVPAFVRILSYEEMKHLMREFQGDPGSKILFAPKLLTFNGQAGSIQTGTVQSFVTGLRTGESRRPEPVTSRVSAGSFVFVRPTVEQEGRTRLAVQCRLTEVVDVDQLKMTVDGKEVTLEVPHVSSLQIATVQSIPAGHTLLVAPLQRDTKGNLNLTLFSPDLP
jgi:type II secretory pathway component GspD/PulD (secretin)